jgi:fluoride exporter
MARFALDGLVLRLASPFFPSGTFVVNVLGCLVFGLIIGLADQRSSLTPAVRLFLLIGLLGGFTTFSTYTFETFQLVRNGQYARGLLNAGGQVIAAYLALWAGFIGTRALL